VTDLPSKLQNMLGEQCKYHVRLWPFNTSVARSIKMGSHGISQLQKMVFQSNKSLQIYI
jgi:hypothetical protein